MMDFTTFKHANTARCEEVFHPLDSWSETDWATALAGECGELCNFIKKRRRGEEISVDVLAKELADVVIYADLLASKLGIHLGDAVRLKFNETSKKRNSTIFL